MIVATNSPDSEVERQRTVLVVEDDVIERGQLAEYLRDAGFRVIEAASAREAMEVLSSEVAVDIVFSDVRMPGGMDGLALARWIGEHSPGIPVLLTSGDRNMRFAEKLPGRAHYIAKPYIYREVERRLHHLLDKE